MGFEGIQSLKINSAIQRHMASGYAAVGEMQKPPSFARPMVFCLWLCPQKRGSGLCEFQSSSRIGQPVLPKPSMPSKSE